MRRLLAALAALLLAPALAGCLDGGGRNGAPAPPPLDELSPAVFGLLPPAEEWVASTVDGKRLHNAVYRPDTDGPVPVFVNFSPYWGDTAMAEGDAFARHMVREYVPRGYAVVLSAVRGTGHSEGCFQIGGDLELRDAHDVVDFFARQPWSTGAVAAGGKSYDSTTQNGLVAKFPHPALKGIFHVSGITDMYRYNYYEGVPYANGLQFTPRYFASQGLDEYASAIGSGGPGDEDPDSLLRLLDDAACAEAPEHVASGEGSALHGMKDAYWAERDWTRSIAASGWEGSIFFVHGLADWNVKPDHVLPWLAEVQRNPGIEVLAWLHQWEEGGTGHVYPMRADWNETMLRWLDHALKGRQNGFERLLGYEVQGTDLLWRRSASWPPPPGDSVRLAAWPDGLEQALPIELPSPDDYRVSGAITVHVNATVRNPDPVLSAVVYDEAPDGTRTWVGEAVLRGLYRGGLESPVPVPQGEPVAFRLTTYPLDHVVLPGHALKVVTGAAPAQSVVLASQAQGIEYEVGVAVVPTAPAGDLVHPQPAPMPCFAC